MDLERIRKIFDVWGSLSTSEREAYLEELCGSDTALRAEYERLLAGDDSLEPTLVDERTSRGAAEYTEGDVIDEFKILAVLGEGGMGVVYLAEQQKPIRRRIALKVIKAGMDSAQVVARFEAERQALAIMNHAGIAQVFDAGTTENGRPYFAMEYVKGVPITTACDEYKLDTTQRLELMIEVCDAVNHAHMKGVIHRDLKPSNILVALGEDDRLHPKIIDFGVAKATAQSLTEKTFFTQVGHFIGTPAYMSPEQADLAAPDIDTRTDVYSLGVVLYEVLAGRPPFDPAKLRSCGLERMREIIREEDPPSPSTALSTVVGEDATRIARARQTQIDALSNVLRRELEWIPLKALRKARTERYESARALGEDIRRYLAGEPLTAGPLSNTYRLKKTLRKHKGPVLATALVMLVLVAGIIGTSIFAFKAEAAAQSEAAQRELAEAAAQSEARQRELAEAAAQSEVDQRELAEAEALRARRNAYAGQLYAAKGEFSARNFGSVTPRMKAAQMALGIDDPEKMPFDWLYLRAMIDQSVDSWGNPQFPTIMNQGVTALSLDGSMVAYNRVRFPSVQPPRQPSTYFDVDKYGESFVQVLDSKTGKELMNVPCPDVQLQRGIVNHNEVTVSRGTEVQIRDNCLKFSPNGSFLAFAHARGIQVWNLRTQEEVHRLIPEPPKFLDLTAYTRSLFDRTGGGIYGGYLGTEGDIAFSGDGTKLAFIGNGFVVQVWDLTTGEELLKSAPQMESVIRGSRLGVIAFSPDGGTVATAVGGAGITLWDVPAGEERRLVKNVPEVTSIRLDQLQRGVLSYSPDGALLALLWTQDQSIRLFDAETGELKARLQEEGNSPRSLAFSSDGSRLVVCGSDSVRTYRLSPEGSSLKREQVLYSGDGVMDDAVFAEDGSEIVAMRGRPSGALMLFVSAPSNCLSEVRRFDLSLVATSHYWKKFNHADWGPYAVFYPDTSEVTPDGTCLIASASRRYWMADDGTRGREVTAADQAAWEKQQVDVMRGDVPTPMVAPRWTTTYVLEVWDLDDARLLGTLPEFEVPEPAFALATSPDGGTLVVGMSSRMDGGRGEEVNAMLYFIDLATGEEVASLRIPEFRDSKSIGFSSDGTRFYVVGEKRNGRDSRGGWVTEKLIQIFDAPTREEWVSARSSPERVPLSWIRNGPTHVISPPESELNNGTNIRPQVRDSVIISPDGSKLAVHRRIDTSWHFYAGWPVLTLWSGGYTEFTLQVWDLDSGLVLCDIPDAEQARAVAFTPDGTELAVTGFGSTSVWKLDTLERQFRVPESGSQITCTPDGERIIVTTSTVPPTSLTNYPSSSDLPSSSREAGILVLDRVTGEELLFLDWRGDQRRRLGLSVFPGYQSEQIYPGSRTRLTSDGRRLVGVGTKGFWVEDVMPLRERSTQREAERIRRAQLEPLVDRWIDATEGSRPQLSALLEAERVTCSEEEMATLERLVFERTCLGGAKADGLAPTSGDVTFRADMLRMDWADFMNREGDHQPSQSPKVN